MSSNNDSEEARQHRTLLDYATTTTSNLYTLLDLPDPFTPHAPNDGPTPSQLKSSWRRAALRHHPDKLPRNASEAQKRAAADRLDECKRAADVLSNAEARRKYDSRRQAEIAERERRERVSGARREMAERLEKAERRASAGWVGNGGGGGADGDGGSPVGTKRRGPETEEERKGREWHRFATEQARKKAEWEDKRRVKLQRDREAELHQSRHTNDAAAAGKPSPLFSTPARETSNASAKARATPGFSFTPKGSPLARAGSRGGDGNPSLFESTMAKLKEAERKRKEQERERLDKEIREADKLEEATAAVG